MLPWFKTQPFEIQLSIAWHTIKNDKAVLAATKQCSHYTFFTNGATEVFGTNSVASRRQGISLISCEKKSTDFS